MKYFYSSLLTLSLLTAPVAVIAKDNPQDTASNQYPEAFVQNYSQECLQTAMSEGLDEISAQKLCDCTVDEFEKEYSLQEFQQLIAVATTDTEAETALIQVGQVCFEEILYE